MFLWALFSRNGFFKCERGGNIYMIVLFFFALRGLGSGRPPPSAAAHRLRRGGGGFQKPAGNGRFNRRANERVADRRRVAFGRARARLVARPDATSGSL